MSDRKADAESRARYAHFRPITTRWMDNDAYGHINNVVYYAYFDTVVNQYLIEEAGFDIEKDPAIGLVVETMCRYHKPLAFPDALDGGLRVGKLGTSSVRYEVAIFRRGDDEPAASGHFVHVYVDRMARKPVPIPDRLRAAMAKLMATSATDGSRS
ncbi:MAG: acyl-CoA thioesterase [Alphaproteobacteria bacterium]|nr:acyl-CoA thioesterase [Alphaproteobacteria bacterium]